MPTTLAATVPALRLLAEELAGRWPTFRERSNVRSIVAAHPQRAALAALVTSALASSGPGGTATQYGSEQAQSFALALAELETA